MPISLYPSSSVATRAFILGAMLALKCSPLCADALARSSRQVAILYDSAPAALSVLNLDNAKLVNFDALASGGTADGSRILLPVPKGERARCQELVRAPAGRRLWVATDTRLVRLDPRTGRVDRNLALEPPAAGAVVDLVAFVDAGRELLAVAASPTPASGELPGVWMIDARDGAVLAGYTAASSSMDRVFALLRDEVSGRFVLSNRRDAFGIPALTVLTGLQWDGTGLAETTSMETPPPDAIPGNATLFRVSPGLAVSISPRMPVLRVVDSSVPTGWGEHPDAEVWGTVVAAGADPVLVDPWGRPDLFYLDAEGGEIVRTRGFDGQTVSHRRLDELGASPESGSFLVVSSPDSAAVVSSPSGRKLVLLDPVSLAPRSVIETPQERPGALLVLR